MISNFSLKFGRRTDAAPLEVDPTQITVFVAPNNSGKSKLLSEIENYCRRGPYEGALILDNIKFIPPTDSVAALKSITVPPNEGELVSAGHIIVGSVRGRGHFQYDQILNCVNSPAVNVQAFCDWFLNHKTLMLDGRSRINLVNEQAAGNLMMPPQSSLQVLFHDDPKRVNVRRIAHEAFGQYFVIDPTELGKLKIRLSSRAPENVMEERGIHKEAVEFHSKALSIADSSDGVKAFIGIITAVLAGDPNVILIDEPEAFLHPSLAEKLGKELSKAALAADKRVFVSTHSPSFVMGCIQSGVPINIVRLTYRAGRATARMLPNEEILKIMRHPLLRSTGVLSGLFYEVVVVTESDADRAFYQEINERLLQFRPEWGIPNCLFINAQNKQTIHTIIRPLRNLGIPAVGIVDVDILKNGGTDWTNILQAASIPSIIHSPLAGIRTSVKAAIDATGKDMKRHGGLNILQGENKEAAENLFRQLSDYGIFVVPGGELESWLKPLGASGHGPSWLVKMFENMGEDPTQSSYVKPGTDDVWEFMARVRQWVMDPARKGIPE